MEIRPLNIFQRCMRMWDEAHPYNAAQVMQVAGAADVSRISAAWNQVLEAAGLGNVRVLGRRFAYETPPPQDVVVVHARQGHTEALAEFITRQMNLPFPDGPNAAETGRPAIGLTMPFRPFVLPANGTHYLGVVYQHWVADSVSLRMLMREWFCRLYDPGRLAARPLHLPHGGLWRYFGPGRSGWNLVGGALSVLRSATQFSHARRIDKASGSHQVACSLHHLPDGMVEALLAVGRRWRRGADGERGSVTLNDLLLAAQARACDAHGAAPRRVPQDLALGTIVDLRPMSAENLENTFGMFLGFTSVLVPAGLLPDRDRVLANIALQTARQKNRRAAAVSMLRVAAGYAQGKILSPQRRAAFYRNYLPLSGGGSNVNMNRSWAAEYHPSPLLDYIRVAPTGPMVPLVIAVTTIGQRLSFVLTRRASLVNDDQGAQLAQAFIDELTAWSNRG